MYDVLSVALASSAALGVAGYVVVERAMRGRWGGSTVEARGAPYRQVVVVTRVARRSPWFVRMAALSGILLGSVAVPGVTYAMMALRSDGLALSLVPGIASAAAVWCTGWLLLARSRIAVDIAALAAKGSVMTHVALLALAMLHVAAARMGWSDRVALAHVLVATALSLVALPQAALLRAMVAPCAPTFEGDRSRARVAETTPAPTRVAPEEDAAPEASVPDHPQSAAGGHSSLRSFATRARES